MVLLAFDKRSRTDAGKKLDHSNWIGELRSSIPPASTFSFRDKHTLLLSNHVTLIHLGQIEEDNDRRIANRGVMAGEFKAAGLAIHLEDSDVVGALVAAIKKLASGVEVEAARIIPSCPFFPYEREVAVWANGKDPDAVVQPVARIDKLPID